MKPEHIPLPKEALLRKLRERDATIAVVGLGYVGLPLALRFAEVGFRVLGFDIDAAQGRARSTPGESYIEHIAPRAIGAARAQAASRRPRDFARAARPTRSSSACRRRSTRTASRT